MKSKSRIIVAVIIVITFLLPVLVFKVVDFIDRQGAHSLYEKDNNPNVMETYPILKEVYSTFYSADANSMTPNAVPYDYTDISIYTETKQLQLRQIQAIFEKECYSEQTYRYPGKPQSGWKSISNPFWFSA